MHTVNKEKIPLPTPSRCPLFRSVAFFRPTRFPRPFFLPALLTPVTPLHSSSEETVTQQQRHKVINPYQCFSAAG